MKNNVIQMNKNVTEEKFVRARDIQKILLIKIEHDLNTIKFY